MIAFAFALLLHAPSAAEASLLFKGSLRYAKSVPASAHYPDEVAVYASDGYQPGSDPGEMILHLHGWRKNREHLGGRLETFDDVLAEFDFDRILRDSGRKGILVIPSSPGKSTAFESHLATPARFKFFLEALGRALSAGSMAPSMVLKPGVLSGHSGSWRAIAEMLGNASASHVGEVYLLDAAYGQAETFARFAASDSARFISVYRPGTPTEDGSFAIWNLLQGSSPSLQDFRDSSLPADVTVERLGNTRTGFVISDQDHWATVGRWLPLLLARWKIGGDGQNRTDTIRFCKPSH